MATKWNWATWTNLELDNRPQRGAWLLLNCCDSEYAALCVCYVCARECCRSASLRGNVDTR